MTKPIIDRAFGRLRKPGFLLKPLGWILDRLTNAIETKPSLIELLLDLDLARMHLTALALAHLPSDVSPDLALTLLQAPRKMVLNLSVGHRPVGIDRVLHQLPLKVLPADTYRKLVELLNDSVTAKFLHHRRSIDEQIVAGLSTLPAALRRPAILAMFDRIPGMELFVEGLRCLADRASLPFMALTMEVGSLTQTDQVAAKIKQIVDSLPLIDTLPPAKVGRYRRIDQIAEIQTLAKVWQNCLANYVSNVSTGTCAIYRTDPPDQPAACFVYRQWRLGWFLQQAKGPRNIDLPPDHLAQTYMAFAAAGIPRSSSIEAIKGLILDTELRRDGHVLEDYEPYDDI